LSRIAAAALDVAAVHDEWGRRRASLSPLFCVENRAINLGGNRQPQHFVSGPHSMTLLLAATCIAADAALPKVSLFERRKKKVARLTAELAKLEAERLSKLVVVFGCEVSYCYVLLFLNRHAF
jgi:hypothetical protein